MSLVNYSCGFDMPEMCLLQSCMMHRSFADKTKALNGKLQPRLFFGRSSGKLIVELAAGSFHSLVSYHYLPGTTL